MLTLSNISQTGDNNMASLNKAPPILPMAPLQAATLQPSHFFITPNYALAATNAQPTDTIIPPGIGITGTPWPTHAALRPATVPCYNPSPADVFFSGQCVMPANSTSSNSTTSSSRPASLPDEKLISAPNNSMNRSDLAMLDTPKDNKRQRKAPHHSTEGIPVKVKKESNEPLCVMRNSESITGAKEHDSSKISYPVSALIDIPGSLTRSSRTSSLSSSLSTVRFGGSLSQLWAASLSSLSGKLSNMKSTGYVCVCVCVYNICMYVFMCMCVCVFTKCECKDR